jgi:outer membrane protein OmpA-like peptidoglycan-associated protein
LRTKGFRKVVPVLALALGTGGCLVTASTYEAKTREADTLREAVASANKEKGILEARMLASEKQILDGKEENAILSARLRETEGELRTAKDQLASIAGKYEGTRITREELISELLEKEKATGKRIQELSAIAEACEAEREILRKDAAAQGTTLSELEKQVQGTPDVESLRRERDILLGRVERMKEERLKEARRRDARFAELAQAFSGISPQIAVETIGPTMRIRVPEKVLFQKGKSALTDAGKKMIGEVAKTASEFSAASILITAEEKSQASGILSALTKGNALPPGQVLAKARTGGTGIELLLVVP